MEGDPCPGIFATGVTATVATDTLIELFETGEGGVGFQDPGLGGARDGSHSKKKDTAGHVDVGDVARGGRTGTLMMRTSGGSWVSISAGAAIVKSTRKSIVPRLHRVEKQLFRRTFS